VEKKEEEAVEQKVDAKVEETPPKPTEVKLEQCIRMTLITDRPLMDTTFGKVGANGIATFVFPPDSVLGNVHPIRAV